MSERTYPGFGTNEGARFAPQFVPYAEQQIRALCLIAAVNAADSNHRLMPDLKGLQEAEWIRSMARDFRVLVAEGGWEAED